MAKKLTQRQREVLTFIKNYIRDKGYPPTRQDIGTGMGFSVKGAQDHVVALVRKGYLEQLSDSPRTLKIPRCFLLLVTENVEVISKTPKIQVGDYLTIREASSADVDDIVIVFQNPIVVKPFEAGDVVSGKVVGFSREID